MNNTYSLSNQINKLVTINIHTPAVNNIGVNLDAITYT